MPARFAHTLMATFLRIGALRILVTGVGFAILQRLASLGRIIRVLPPIAAHTHARRAILLIRLAVGIGIAALVMRAVAAVDLLAYNTITSIALGAFTPMGTRTDIMTLGTEVAWIRFGGARVDGYADNAIATVTFAAFATKFPWAFEVTRGILIAG